MYKTYRVTVSRLIRMIKRVDVTTCYEYSQLVGYPVDRGGGGIVARADPTAETFRCRRRRRRYFSFVRR